MPEQRDPEGNPPAPSRFEPSAPADPEDASSGGRPAPTGDPPSDLPPPEEFEALDEEEAVVEEAAERPAIGVSRAREGDQSHGLFIYATMALGVLLVFGWIGATALWQLRRDLSGLDSQMEALRLETRRTEAVRSRATVYRIQADLEALRETLPAEFGQEVGEAQEILGGIAKRLSSAP